MSPPAHPVLRIASTNSSMDSPISCGAMMFLESLNVDDDKLSGETHM